MHARPLPASPWLLIIAYCLVWALVHGLSQPNLDAYHDMLENFAWSQTWAWGTFKHPPLFAWVVKLWFSVAPQTTLSYKLLAYLNVAAGLAGVAWLARLLGLAVFGRTAVLLLLWSLPYTTLAAKFNANSILLSLWPWTAAAWLASVQRRGGRGLAASVLLGVLAAACVLSKYFSGVLLLGLLLAALLSADGRRWLLGARSWLALAVFAVGLAPHALWLLTHDFPTLRYAMEQGGGDTQWRYVAKFALAPLFYWAPAWLACVSVFAWSAPRQRVGTWLRLAVASWRAQSAQDTLFWLAALPGGITLIFGLFGVAELSTPWAIPIGFAFPLLWLRNLAHATAPPPGNRDNAVTPAPRTARGLAALQRAAWPVLAAVVAAGGVLAVTQARQGEQRYYAPTEEAARAMAAGWRERHPDVPLGWTGGQWADNALVAFYVSGRIRALPGLPDQWPATLTPHPTWAQEGGLLICPHGPVTKDATARTACEQQAEDWLHGHGHAVLRHRLEAARSGWRFPHPVPHAYVVYDVLPASTSP